MIIFFAFVIVFLIYTFGYLLNFLTFPVLWNFESFCSVLVYGIIALLGAGMLKDFKNAFVILFYNKQKFNIAKMKRAIDALELEIRAQLFAAILILCGAAVKILGIYTVKGEFNSLWEFPYIGLHSVYALTLILLLLPAKYRLKGKLADYMSENEG